MPITNAVTVIEGLRSTDLAPQSFFVFFFFWSNGRPSFLRSAAMRKLWRTASILGPAFAALLWSKKQTAASAPSSDYELKLVQVLFRHGARTPLKSIPDVMEVRPFLSD